MGIAERQAVLTLAQRQYGVVSRAQMRALPLTPGQIRTLLNAGWVIPVFNGVYSVGRPIERYEGWLMAGVLMAGPGAAACRSCAAALWGIGERPGPIEVVRDYNKTPHRQYTSSQGNGRKLIIHRSRALAESEVTRHRGVPVTTVARTLLDIAPGLKTSEFRDVFDEAGRRNKIDLPDLERVLGRGSGRHGSAALRELVDEWHPDDARARSKLERRFIRLCKQRGFRRPETNVQLLGYEVDCLWRSERVVVELDSVGFHSQPSVLDSDRERDIDLRMNGYEVLRFTHRRVTAKPGWVVAKLRQAMDGPTAYRR